MGRTARLYPRNTKDPQETLQKSIELAKKALSMDDSISSAHSLLGMVYTIQGKHDKAIAEGSGPCLNPGSAPATLNYGSSLILAGRAGEAIPLFEKVIRLTPLVNRVYIGNTPLPSGA